MFIQPCDWIETDVDFKYVVDVFGRTNDGDVARLRLTGFHPFMYLKVRGSETSVNVIQALEQANGKQLRGIKLTKEMKLDAMNGFSGLTPIAVWKISCSALWMFKNVSKA